MRALSMAFSRSIPPVGATYYTVESDGKVYADIWNSAPIHRERYEMGLVFYTWNEADHARERIKSYLHGLQRVMMKVEYRKLNHI